MGYAMCTSACGACRKIFMYNPKYVPSLKNIPFCQECMESANRIRESKGIAPHIIHPKAYEPLPEELL